MNVLITAGASGIGHEMAAKFAQTGANIWVADIDGRALQNCPKTWNTRHVDVSDETAVAALMSDIGTLDVLCANAGIAGPTAPIHDVHLTDWQKCVSVNLQGAFLATKHAAPAMIKAKSGAIIYTSSTAGLYGYPNRAPYAAAKWAIIGLMKTTAMELGPMGIRANAICPGAVEGPRMQSVLNKEAIAKNMTPQDVYDGYAAGTSMKTWVEAHDIANLAVFLGSPSARYISGQVIAVDGHTENPDPKP